ncbi:tetratricopeptide repeat protein [Streptomyces sp. NBC_00838]|uniref:tetratricopeptide repeat protein n=1 Tax=Streptomyces sp. NBC_00838 TaxID=2903680 RepID=UPI00386A0F4C|nr:tetratricopeptide repeat protein [Streptomyces sp. NBC_00838]
MELSRVVAVLLPGAEQRYGGNGTGYLLGSRLILTARHVLDGRDACDVQVPGGRAVPCTIIWRGATHVDAALLLAEADVREQVAPVRWGRLVTARHQPCDVTGYPEAGRRADGGLDLQQPRATLSPGTGALSHRYAVELASAPPADPTRRTPSPWSGQSGAALFSGALLTGVVVTDVSGWGLPRWEAVPVYALLADLEFTDLVTRHTAAAPVWEPVDLQSLITPAAGWRVRSPATLLDQRAEVVRFHGREHLLGELIDDWCDGNGVELAVITGPGGAGKSRLARELCTQLRDRHGWVCGWLDERGPAEDLGVLAEVDRPLILVADYAELRIAQLTALLTVLDRRPDGRPPVRLLLTARGRGDSPGGWWDQLRTRTRETRNLTYDALHQELPPLTELPDRDAHYHDALTDLARRLPEALPRALRDVTGDWTGRVALVAPCDVNAPEYSSALTLHMTALTNLLATHPATRLDDTGLRVEEQLLLHERAYWEDSAAGRPRLAEVGPIVLADAVGTAVLTAGVEPALTAPLLRSSPGFRTADAPTLDQGTAWLAEMYPAPGDSCWGALQPDRLGEYHVGDRTRADTDLVTLPLLTLARAKTALLRSRVEEPTPAGNPESRSAPPSPERRTASEAARTEQPTSTETPPLPSAAPTLLAALVTLSRVTELPRHWDPVARALDEALAREPALAGAVMEAATLTESPEPLIEALHRLTDAPDTDPELLLELLDRLGAGRSRVLAGWATRTAATAARRLPPALRAAALVHEAGWRQAAGDHWTAIRRCDEALRLYDSGKAEATSAARFAALLTIARSHLRTAGFDEALAALDRATDLVDTLAPADQAPAEAEILGERARILVGGGDDDAASPLQEQRVTLLRSLADGGDPVILERLADAEAELALTLNRMGEFRAAAQMLSEPTAQTLRQLVDERPDALGHDAVGSLIGRANRLRVLGRSEEALAVLRDALAVVDRPESLATPVSAGTVAVVLNNIGATLVAMGRPEEALEPIRRGLAIRRSLAADDGGPNELFWSSLLAHGSVLTELGRLDEAREAAEECLKVGSELVRRKISRPRVEAQAQIMLAQNLIELAPRNAVHQGDLRRAKRLVDRAVRSYDRDIKNLPGDHLGGYAALLSVAVDLYFALGRRRSARSTISRVMLVRRLLVRRDPEQHGDSVAAQLEAQARECSEAGQMSNAEGLLGQAAALRQVLLDVSGLPTDRSALANTLAQYAGVLSQMGHQREALPHLHRALELMREVEPHAEPGQYALAVATCHYNLADTLPWTGAFDEALREVAASEKSLAPLADLNPDLYAREKADCAQLRVKIIKAAERGLPERRHP